MVLVAKPQKIEYIEAHDGSLCQELLNLLGGNIKVIKRPRRGFIKILDIFLPKHPLCRWYPPENSKLEFLGYNDQIEEAIYRFTKQEQQPIIFFVQYKPKPHLDMKYFLDPSSLFNNIHSFSPYNDRIIELSKELWKFFSEK